MRFSVSGCVSNRQKTIETYVPTIIFASIYCICFVLILCIDHPTKPPRQNPTSLGNMHLCTTSKGLHLSMPLKQLNI